MMLLLISRIVYCSRLGHCDAPKLRQDVTEQMIAYAKRCETNSDPINECIVDLFRK